MANQGSLTIYNRDGQQVAGTQANSASNGYPALFSNHCNVGYKDGQAKTAFFYSGPHDSHLAGRAMNIAESMEYSRLRR
jgi:hypothetical protein